MEAKGLTPDRYISGNTINEYLQKFAEKNDLGKSIRLQTRVKSIEKQVTKDTNWLLTIDNGRQESLLASTKLIVASGASSGPYMPDIPRSEFGKPVIHSGQIGTSISDLKLPDVKRVVVLGAAKSAYDAVFLMLKQGKKVDWVIRADGTGPLAIMPPRLLGFLNTIDVMSTRAFACFSPAILQTKGFWYYVLQRSWAGRHFTRLVWRMVTYLAEHHAGYSRNGNIGKLRPVPTGYGYIIFKVLQLSIMANRDTGLFGRMRVLALLVFLIIGRPCTQETSPFTVHPLNLSPKGKPILATAPSLTRIMS